MKEKYPNEKKRKHLCKTCKYGRTFEETGSKIIWCMKIAPKTDDLGFCEDYIEREEKREKIEQISIDILTN